ncbi:hypothetical protein ABIC71_001529 [Herbaspirillum seropedicae]|jgi:hypothetical protein|uniref:hypothetical protein n=1 Tax=Herbaspirillum seropedicae TaxID=964 RepID=UPI003397BD0F
MNPSFTARPANGEAARAADLRALQHDPAARRTLMAWQATAADTVTKLIDSLTQQLAGAAGPTTPTPTPAAEAADHYDFIRARAHAQRRQAHLEQCRQLAQDMVFDALHHLDDPQWSPLQRQEEAHGAAAAPPPPTVPPDNLLLMLLKLELAGQ